jgi:chromosome segregation ATPase
MTKEEMEIERLNKDWVYDRKGYQVTIDHHVKEIERLKAEIRDLKDTLDSTRDRFEEVTAGGDLVEQIETLKAELAEARKVQQFREDQKVAWERRRCVEAIEPLKTGEVSVWDAAIDEAIERIKGEE